MDLEGGLAELALGGVHNFHPISMQQKNPLGDTLKYELQEVWVSGLNQQS
jgi:hypothetical protein